MLAPVHVVMVISMLEPIYLNAKPYEPYTLNRVITTQDMFNTGELIEKIFIQEKKNEID
jgi:hypothetical protein